MKKVSAEYVDHGINTSYFQISTIKKRQFISSSQLIYRKNIESIIGIFGRLIKVKGYEDMQLLIAGRGEYRRYLEERVSQLNLHDRVSFTGFLSQIELNDRIKESCAFLINTRQDLNVVSIPEAIVSGTPVVTNLIPASADYVAKEKLGIAKDNWNEYDLIEIIENNPVYVNNCVNYREKLTNNYCAGKIVEIYWDYCKRTK
jgi:1,2-diacylglycerol 3-alpha-glucosyltransferase